MAGMQVHEIDRCRAEIDSHKRGLKRLESDAKGRRQAILHWQTRLADCEKAQVAEIEAVRERLRADIAARRAASALLTRGKCRG